MRQRPTAIHQIPPGRPQSISMKYGPLHQTRGALELIILKEVKLVSSSGERDLYESLAEIYSIIVTLDGLEKAYIKDVVTEAEYTETCTRLLKQYKSSLGDETVAREFVDLESFKRTWGVRTFSSEFVLSVSLIGSTAGMPPSYRTTTNRPPRDCRTGFTQCTQLRQWGTRRIRRRRIR